LTRQLPTARLATVPQHFEYRLRAMFADQSDAKVWDEPPGTVDSFEFQEAA